MRDLSDLCIRAMDLDRQVAFAHSNADKRGSYHARAISVRQFAPYS